MIHQTVELGHLLTFSLLFVHKQLQLLFGTRRFQVVCYLFHAGYGLSDTLG